MDHQTTSGSKILMVMPGYVDEPGVRQQATWDSRWLTMAHLLAAAWTLFAAGWLIWQFHGHGFDDPYITYRYANNLAHGSGFVYNLNERVLSTTTPLYTIVLAFLGLLGLDIPLASNVISCLSIGISGWAVWELGLRWGARRAAAAGLVLLPLFPHLTLTLGAETTFYIACVLLGFVAYARQRMTTTAVLLAMATLTRADGVLAAGVIGIHLLFTRRSSIPWRAMALYAALLAPWFLFAWLYFGAPLPVTLYAKQQQGQMAASQSYLQGLLPLVKAYWDQPLYRLHFVLALVGIGYGLSVDRRFLLLPAWSMLYFVAYSLLGVTRYFWYYAPLVPGFIAMVALGLEAVGRFLRRFTNRHVAAGAIAVLIAVLLVPQLQTIRTMRHTPDPRVAAYQAVGEWLRASTPADASVGTLETGVIGYYAERRVIDFAGLIQPEVARRLTATTTYEDAALWAIEHFRPDYLVLYEGTFPRVEDVVMASGHCRSEVFFDGPKPRGRLVVYSCVATP